MFGAKAMAEKIDEPFFGKDMTLVEMKPVVREYKGKKNDSFDAIFKDPETGEKCGIWCFGLLAYMLNNEVEIGESFDIIYEGKDDENRHQCSIMDHEVASDSIPTKKPAPSKSLGNAEESAEGNDYGL